MKEESGARYIGRSLSLKKESGASYIGSNLNPEEGVRSQVYDEESKS